MATATATTRVPMAAPTRSRSALCSPAMATPTVATEPTATPEQMLTATRVQAASVSSAPRCRYCL